MRPHVIDRSLFDRLADVSGEALVSIYLPTHVKGAEIQQDRIRLKNGLAEVDDQLEQEAGWPPQARAARLDPARALLEDEEFWRHQGTGLGVLIDDEARLTTVALAGGAPERAIVSTVFHLRPMAPSLHAVTMPILVLTKGAVRLYQTSRQEITPVDADLPESFEDVNWFVDRERQRQRHPDRTGTDRARHGHEGGHRDEDLERFLRAVAQALGNLDGPEPLVVLGDDNLAARFAKVSEQETMSPGKGGIDDVDDASQVLLRATEVMKEREASLLEKRIEEARAQLGTGAAITDITDGLEAAVVGRVAVLLLDTESDPVWGSFDPETLETSRYEKRRAFALDLLDRLTVHAIGTKAEVVATEGPIDGHPFVAMTRF